MATPKIASIAQLVERLFSECEVVGSNLGCTITKVKNGSSSPLADALSRSHKKGLC